MEDVVQREGFTCSILIVAHAAVVSIGIGDRCLAIGRHVADLAPEPPSRSSFFGVQLRCWLALRGRGTGPLASLAARGVVWLAGLPAGAAPGVLGCFWFLLIADDERRTSECEVGVRVGGGEGGLGGIAAMNCFKHFPKVGSIGLLRG